LASVVLPAPFWPTIAIDEPAAMVRSKCSSTGWPAAYANVTSRKRISRAGSPIADAVPDASAPADAIASSRRNTAATGADAPSSAQEKPPNASSETPIAACAKTTSSGSDSLPLDAAAAIDQNTSRLAASTIRRLHVIGFSRSRVASYWSVCSRVRRSTKRAIVQPARPNSRSSFAGPGSTARR
jgi:hypothetical protein